MSKKTWLLILALALIIGGLVFVLVIQPKLFSSKDKPEVASETAVHLIEWIDPAGFKFSYPEDLILDPHQEDEENYAHLELVSNEHSGRVIIWVQATEYADIDEWVAVQPKDIQVLETELGGFLAKKIAFTSPQKLVTATIDVDALVLVEMIPDPEGYFQPVYDQIIQSFEFIPLKGDDPAKEAAEPGPALPPAGGQIIEEAEEVIE